ncbi:MAG TPA: TusE/DsrC/DsvC family sulfur relay protein [Thermoanaerobaculia bacterium]
MPTRTYAGREISLNNEGFLTNASEWTPGVAEEIAKETGIGTLNDKHWQVITFCREDAAREGQPPGVRRIAKLSGVEMKELYQLFPKGPGKLAARIAGLPKPQGCI